MPAVTVSDLTTVPRITTPVLNPRSVKRIESAPSGFEGEGFPVHRAFAGASFAELDPFIHMDEMGAVEYAPGEPKGTPWHPHRGFETVTYIIDGTFEHRDSHGGGGLITNGDTQWMTAGSGLLHIERPPESLVMSGGLFHGIQLWVNLPSADKMITPKYQDIRASQVALATNADATALIRIVSGAIDEHRGAGSTHTPINVVHVTVSAGSRAMIPWPASYNALAYVMSGQGTVSDTPIGPSQLAIMNSEGDGLTLTADTVQQSNTPDLEIILLGGLPIREPVAAYGPFVMNTRSELRQAFEDFQAGRLGTIPEEERTRSTDTE